MPSMIPRRTRSLPIMQDVPAGSGIMLGQLAACVVCMGSFTLITSKAPDITCPFCSFGMEVIDERWSEDQSDVTEKVECINCGKYFEMEMVTSVTYRVKTNG